VTKCDERGRGSIFRLNRVTSFMDGKVFARRHGVGHLQFCYNRDSLYLPSGMDLTFECDSL